MKNKIIKKDWLKRIYEVYTTRDDLTIKGKAQLLNKEFGTNFGESAFRKKAKSYGEGLQAGLEDSASEKELERIAKSLLTVKKERKINEIQRYHLNKEVNENSAFDEIKKILKDRLSNIKPQKIQVAKKNKDYTEMFFVGDEQHRGYEEEVEQLRETFRQIAKHSTNKHIILNLLGVIPVYLGLFLPVY